MPKKENTLYAFSEYIEYLAGLLIGFTFLPTLPSQLPLLLPQLYPTNLLPQNFSKIPVQ
jgi:hypothetical protein